MNLKTLILPSGKRVIFNADEVLAVFGNLAESTLVMRGLPMPIELAVGVHVFGELLGLEVTAEPSKIIT